MEKLSLLILMVSISVDMLSLQRLKGCWFLYELLIALESY